jgi:hypothetical protein
MHVLEQNMYVAMVNQFGSIAHHLFTLPAWGSTPEIVHGVQVRVLQRNCLTLRVFVFISVVRAALELQLTFIRCISFHLHISKATLDGL